MSSNKECCIALSLLAIALTVGGLFYLLGVPAIFHNPSTASDKLLGPEIGQLLGMKDKATVSKDDKERQQFRKEKQQFQKEKQQFLNEKLQFKQAFEQQLKQKFNATIFAENEADLAARLVSANQSDHGYRHR